MMWGGGETGGQTHASTTHTCRGKKLGVKIIQALERLGGLLGCYKVILDCSEDNVKFYTRCGFKQKEVQMVAYISGNEQPRPRL